MSLKSCLVCSWLWLWFPLSLAMRGHITSLDQSVVAPKQKHCGEAISWNPGFSVGWMCFSDWNPTKTSLFFSEKPRGVVVFFFFRGEDFIPFQTIFVFGNFLVGLATTLSSEMPGYHEIGRKEWDPVRMWNKFHASSDQNPPTHISVYWLVFLGFGILIMANYNP